MFKITNLRQAWNNPRHLFFRSCRSALTASFSSWSKEVCSMPPMKFHTSSKSMLQSINCSMTAGDFNEMARAVLHLRLHLQLLIFGLLRKLPCLRQPLAIFNLWTWTQGGIFQAHLSWNQHDNCKSKSLCCAGDSSSKGNLFIGNLQINQTLGDSLSPCCALQPLPFEPQTVSLTIGWTGYHDWAFRFQRKLLRTSHDVSLVVVHLSLFSSHQRRTLAVSCKVKPQKV